MSKGSLGRTNFLGRAIIELSELEEGEVHSCWFDLHSLNPKDKKSYGKIYFLLQQVSDHNDGFLAHYGSPLSCIPLRVNYGDILFFSSKGFVSSATRIATW